MQGTSLRESTWLLCPSLPSYFILSVASLLDSGFLCLQWTCFRTGPTSVLPPPSTAFRLTELSRGGFAIQINLWRESIHFTNSPVYPLFFYSVCSYICISSCVCIYTHTHTYTYAYMYICPLQGPWGQQQKFNHSFSWSFLQVHKSWLFAPCVGEESQVSLATDAVYITLIWSSENPQKPHNIFLVFSNRD